jgi:hypothetical protein
MPPRLRAPWTSILKPSPETRQTSRTPWEGATYRVELLDQPGSPDEKELLFQWLGYLRGTVLRNLDPRTTCATALTTPRSVGLRTAD